MFTTIATLEYLIDTHVNDFCKLSFVGIDDDIVLGMSDSWERVKNERKRDNDLKIEQSIDRILELKEHIADISSEYSRSKKWYRPNNFAERQMLEQIDRKTSEIQGLETVIEKLAKRNEFSAKSLKNKAHELLLKNGFILISRSEGQNTTEIWHKFSGGNQWKY